MAYSQEPLSQNLPESSSTISSSKPLPDADLESSKVPQRLIERHVVNDAAIDLPQRAGDLAVYWFYLRAVGRLRALFMVFCTATYSFALTFSSYILKWTIEAPPEDLRMYMGLYVAISGVAWIATNGIMW